MKVKPRKVKKEEYEETYTLTPKGCAYASLCDILDEYNGNSLQELIDLFWEKFEASLERCEYRIIDIRSTKVGG